MQFSPPQWRSLPQLQLIVDSLLLRFGKQKEIHNGLKMPSLMFMDK
jgi:hypothetical protein